MLTVLAPAKVNLTLEVLAERPDGFHEIRSVVQTINLYDCLSFETGSRIEFRCGDPSWIAGESLVSKTADLLRKATGVSKGARVVLDRHIPLVSGLSGDSSDAAATLRGLHRLWGLGLSQRELHQLAAQLGSDVPFFLYGGTALLEGKGELITPLPPLGHRWVIVVLPPVERAPGKTARLYAGLSSELYTDGQITDRLVTQLSKGEVTSTTLFNIFDSVAPSHFSGLGVYQEQFLDCGAREVHLAGSGPALFTLVEDRTQAERVYQSLCQKGLRAYLTHTLDSVDYQRLQ